MTIEEACLKLAKYAFHKNPISYSFYSKFGYSYVFNQKHYEIDAADFPLGEKTHLTVKRTDFMTAQEDLAYVHAQAVGNGSLVRGGSNGLTILTIRNNHILQSFMTKQNLEDMSFMPLMA
ncbi:MAG: hypothetical protein ACTIDA_07900 [Pseudolactococcus laudensis]